MRITRKNWKQYIRNLAKADDKAAALITEYLSNHEIVSDAGFNAFADFFYAVVTKYAEGASEMAAQAYETIAEAQGVTIKSAMPATTPAYGEVLKAIRGTMLTSDQPKALAQAAGRLVRRTGVDTTINNALRDGAEWAWVPSGDTCAFCMMLASEGWHKASKAALKNGHAKHIHANCDCTYAVRFDGKSTVDGYDPGYYKTLFDNAEGGNWKQKMNSIRREKYAVNKDKINAQKRFAYKARNSKESVAISTNDGIMNLGGMYRNKSNTGAFEQYEERMSKKRVREVSEEYGISLKGITLKIDFNEELIGKRYTGRADYEKVGAITLFPEAFRSKEELLRTIYHEIQHVSQYKEYGVQFVQNNRAYFEDLAYAAEDLYIEDLKRSGRL